MLGRLQRGGTLLKKNTYSKSSASSGKVREVPLERIIEVVAELCGRSNIEADPILLKQFRSAERRENSPRAREILRIMLENARIARQEKLPLCQDTGLAVVFLEIGQDVHITGGDLYQGVNEGVRRGYARWSLRKSVVADPILRGNTGDNTPAVIHVKILPGRRVRITVAPKGFGSENAGALTMLDPGEGEAGVKKFVVETVREKGAKACPPLVIGVGLGGTMEKAALLSKEALALPAGVKNKKTHLAKLERDLLKEINSLGIGPQGLGGKTTALAVHILSYPTHIAGLPVAVNICCHVCRHESKII